uniref:Uncharacterized protein n=1 Tax=Amphiprion ocellaris TaxID=80972 RepID=A0A3Q1BNN2_AMPOC
EFSHQLPSATGSTGAGVNFSGRPGMYAVLVKCWYHLSAFRAKIFLTCSSTCRSRADLLLAVREATIGGYSGSFAALSGRHGQTTAPGPHTALWAFQSGPRNNLVNIRIDEITVKTTFIWPCPAKPDVSVDPTRWRTPDTSDLCWFILSSSTSPQH